MKKGIKQQWIEALRSGDYKQGKYTLKDEEERYCCLGILCELVDEDGWGELTEVDTKEIKTFKFTYLDSIQWQSSYIPLDLMNEIDLHVDEQDTLAQMNDEGFSFTEIADWIEENL